MGLLIYARSIYFIRTHHKDAALAAAEGGSALRPKQPAGRTS